MLLDSKITRLTRNGELEVNLQPVHPYCLYFKPWDQGLGVYTLDMESQINEYQDDPVIPLLSQARNVMSGPALLKFVEGIPGCFIDFAEKFVYNQIKLLPWLARFPAARDLITNNPVLLWMLVEIAL